MPQRDYRYARAGSPARDIRDYPGPPVRASREYYDDRRDYHGTPPYVAAPRYKSGRLYYSEDDPCGSYGDDPPGSDDSYSTARSDSIGSGGSRDSYDIEDQEARDSEASIFSPHLYRHLGLHKQLIYSLRGNEAAEAGSKIHSVRSRFVA